MLVRKQERATLCQNKAVLMERLARLEDQATQHSIANVLAVPLSQATKSRRKHRKYARGLLNRSHAKSGRDYDVLKLGAEALARQDKRGPLTIIQEAHAV